MGAHRQHRSRPGAPPHAATWPGRGRRMGAGRRHWRQHAGRQPLHSRDRQHRDRAVTGLPGVRRLRGRADREPGTHRQGRAAREAGPGQRASPVLRHPVVVLRSAALFGFGYLAWDEWRKRGSDEHDLLIWCIPIK